MSCPSWQRHRTGSRWSPVRTLPVAPLWCDLGFFPNSRGNKPAANLPPTDLHVSRAYPRSYLLVPWLCLHLQLMHIRPNIGPAGQPNYSPHTYITTRARWRTHVLYAAFFLRLRVNAGALPAPRRQPPVLEWLQDRACRFADSPRRIACLLREKTTICLHRRLIGRENRCQ